MIGCFENKAKEERAHNLLLENSVMNGARNACVMGRDPRKRIICDCILRIIISYLLILAFCEFLLAFWLLL